MEPQTSELVFGLRLAVVVMLAAMNWNQLHAEDENRAFVQATSIRTLPEIAAKGDNYLIRGQRNAQAFWRLLQKLELGDMKIDLDILVEYVCSPNWTDAKENFQEAIEELTDTETSTYQC